MMDKLGSPKCSDFFSAAHNHHASIIEPLRRMNASVVSVFHTFRSSCAKRDEALVNFLKPMAHVFEDITARGRIVDSYIRALDLLQATGVLVGHVLLARFDNYFRRPLDELRLAWEKVNFAFRDHAWECCQYASDLFFFLPSLYHASLRSALNTSGSQRQHNAKQHRHHHGSGHYTFGALAAAIGAERISFMDDGKWTSMQDAPTVCEYAKDPVSVGILRYCTLDVCLPVLARCEQGVAVYGESVGLSMTDGFALRRFLDRKASIQLPAIGASSTSQSDSIQRSDAPPAIDGARSRVTVALVSASVHADGRVSHDAALDALEALVPSLGFAKIFTWRDAEVAKAVAASPVLAGVALQGQGHAHNRPHCAAFKPLLLLLAMEQLGEGDYVVWADASKYFNYSSTPQQRARLGALVDVRRAVRRLQASLGAAADVAHGAMACPADCERGVCNANRDNDKVSKATLLAFGDLITGAQGGSTIAEFLDEPHAMTTNLLLRNTEHGRRLMRDWLDMAVREPRGFCDSHPQDQTAWTILARARKLPLVDACSGFTVSMRQPIVPPNHTHEHSLLNAVGPRPSLGLLGRRRYRMNCHHYSKHLLVWLDALQRGHFRVLPPVVTAAIGRNLTCGA